eukprot:3266521-Pyramimonas_sp.AAC.1
MTLLHVYRFSCASNGKGAHNTPDLVLHLVHILFSRLRWESSALRALDSSRPSFLRSDPLRSLSRTPWQGAVRPFHSALRNQRKFVTPEMEASGRNRLQ